MKPTFKTTNGIYYTKQLFYETADVEREFVLYTLKNEDHEGFPSLRRLYMEISDETEFKVADTLFGGWPHWKKLLQCSWFLEYLQEWREELRVKTTSLSLSKLILAAEKGDAKVNQYLLDRELRLSRSSVGRPTKAKIKQEAALLVQAQDDIKEDLKRLLQ